VCTEDDRSIVGYFVQLLDEYRSLVPKLVDDILVVYNFMADINGRTMQFNGALDDLDGAIHAGTKSPGVCQNYLPRLYVSLFNEFARR